MKTKGALGINGQFGIGAVLVILAIGLGLAWLPVSLMAPGGVAASGFGWALLLGAGVAALSGVPLLMAAIRRSARLDAARATARPPPLTASGLPSMQGPGSGPSLPAIPATGPKSSAREAQPQFDTSASAAALQDVLGEWEMSELRDQVETLCRMLGQVDASAALRAELLDARVVRGAQRAAGLSQLVSKVLNSSGFAEAFAMEGLPVAPSTLAEARQNLTAIAGSLGWLAQHRLKDPADSEALRSELLLQMKLTEELSPLERLLFLSTLLLSSVADLSEALVERCAQLRARVHHEAEFLTLEADCRPIDDLLRVRPWPGKAGTAEIAAMDWTDGEVTIPDYKLN